MRFATGVFSLFLSLVVISAAAQTPLEKAFQELEKGSEIPDALQSTRTAVFLNIDPATNVDPETFLGKDGDWQSIVDQFHKNLVEMHIDAVAYFRWQDLISGYDATSSYLEDIQNRGISQIIVLVTSKGKYEIYVIPTADDPGLLATDNPVWYNSSNSLEGLVQSFATAVQQADLETANFLIAEAPELFVDTEVFNKNRFESFQPDLKLDKLAVPLFYGNDPENIEYSQDQELMSIIRRLYPFYYELVSVGMTEELMQKAGFHYVLRLMSARESTLMTLLDYTEPASNSTELMHKFYIKHLITGDIYLGDTWDGRPTWQSALITHLSNMRNSLEVE